MPLCRSAAAAAIVLMADAHIKVGHRGRGKISADIISTSQSRSKIIKNDLPIPRAHNRMIENLFAARGANCIVRIILSPVDLFYVSRNGVVIRHRQQVREIGNGTDQRIKEIDHVEANQCCASAHHRARGVDCGHRQRSGCNQIPGYDRSGRTVPIPNPDRN
jgi:hypothetical protein